MFSKMSDHNTLVFAGLLILFLIICQSEPICDENFQRKIQFVRDYLQWRKFSFLIVIDENIKSGCHLEILKKALNTCSSSNIYFSLRSSRKNLDRILRKTIHKTLAVSFLKYDPWAGYTEQTDLSLFNENTSWLIITSSDQKVFLDAVKNTTFGLDSDIVVAFDLNGSVQNSNDARDQAITEHGKQTLNSTNTDSNVSGNTKCFVPFQEGSNFNLNNSCNSESVVPTGNTFCLLQFYKIRKSMDSSLVTCPLGIWDSTNSTKNLQPFVDIEKRENFYGFPLIFGNKDLDKVLNQDDPSDDEEDSSDMNEFSSYFITILNASKMVLDFPRVGKKEETGEWTHLLGAIVKDEIDISSECVSKNLERFNDMSFTHDVLTTTKNIYIQPEESNEFRDIFFLPFDNRLMFCVLGTCVLFSLAMTISNKISSTWCSKDNHSRTRGFLDSIIWCVAIFSQQGTIWKPLLYGGRIVVLISLAFTLLIYNSYSAFITSVLSVKLTSIRNVDDLLKSDYEIGYARNGQDEVYLRSMNMSQLNHIYLRGYLENDVSNVSEGLLKVTKGNYGFFASGHLARKELLNISNYRCRFNIDEIPIKYTVDHMAFVTPKRSPYRKLINLSIIKMFETGVYKYIYSHIQPDLPKCEEKKSYQSPRLVDLSTAFFILILGHVLGVIFVIGECIWNRKRDMFKYMKNKVSTGGNEDWVPE